MYGFKYATSFKKKKLYLERGEGREKESEKEKHQCVIASHVAPTRDLDLACNPGMCPDWEWNWRPFGSQPMLSPLSHTSQGNMSLL